jgi:hypothetical protein
MDTALDFPTAHAPEASASFREIRVAGSSMSDTDDIPAGHLFIVGYGDNVNEDLGADGIDCTILRQAMKTTGEWNDSDPSNRHYMYNSSEFLDWGDIVVLYDTHSIPTKIVAALPYSHRNPDLPSIGGKGEKALKAKCNLRLRYVFYVLYKDEIFRMNGGSTDFTGADANDKPFGFNEPEELSFSHFLKDCEGEPMYNFSCKLSGKKHSKKIFPKQFAKVKKLTEAKQKDVYEKLTELYESIGESHWNRFGKAMDEDNKLDPWSEKVVAILKENTFDSLLKGKGKEMFKVSMDSLPDVVDVQFVDAPSTEAKEQAVVDAVAESMDPGGLTDALKSDTKIEEVPF